MFFSLRQKSLLFLILVLLVSSYTVLAGDEGWRPVTPAELDMKKPVVEQGADAEAIFWEVRIDDSSSEKLTQNHYVRVKIYTELGREKYSKFDIPFVKGLKIKDIAARVIKPDGSIVEIAKTDIFEREIIKIGGEKVKAKSFAVPGIEPGVIVEYRYKEVEESAGAVGMHLTMQRDVPVQNLSYYYKPYNDAKPSYQAFVDQAVTFVKDKNGFYLASRQNIPAFKEEARMPPEDTVRPWVLLQKIIDVDITSVSMNGSFTFTFKDPNNPRQYWAGFGAERAEFVKTLAKPNGDIKKAAAEIVGTASTDEEKLQKLYEFCQTQIKNTSYDVALTDEARAKLPAIKSTQDVLKRKMAPAGWVDMLFGSLASSLGYEIRLAYAGNRSKIFFDPERMANERLVHVAAIAIKVGEEWKYFNPGMYFLPYGSLIWYEEDVWAILVGEKRYSMNKTPFSDQSKTKTKRTAKLKLLEDGTLEGDVTEELTGQLALTYKVSYYDESPSKREEDLKNEIKERASTAEVTNVTIENADIPFKPVIKKYNVRIPNYAQKTGKRLFLQPGFFEYGEDPLFASADRKYDVYFNYAWSEDDIINISLPAGYDLDNADAPGELKDAQDIGLLKLNIAHDAKNNILKYERRFFFGGGGNTLFPQGAYPALKQFFDNFHKSDTHTLSLRQK